MPWLVWPKKDAHSAKVVGELSKSFDPAVSEWGNPVYCRIDYPDFCQGGKLGN